MANVSEVQSMNWPIYKVKRNGKRVALNPELVSAIHEKEDGWTEVYTLDCAKDEDAWDVQAPFDEVVKALTAEQVINVEAPLGKKECSQCGACKTTFGCTEEQCNWKKQ